MLMPSKYKIKKTRKIPKKNKYDKTPERIETYYIQKTKYMIKRMLPPGKIKYIFSTPKKLLFAKD